MTSIAKPKILHKGIERNALKLTLRDYEGALSTLCAGCGHDSVTAAIVRAFFELDIPPHRAAKVSGIGCSSKTTAYFLGKSHGNNTVHGRMPSVMTGASTVNPELYYIGVSGDGDSLSIGLGQFAHAIRRNINITYIVENNGVYGLTKGQFSASADLGTRTKTGELNEQAPIDPVKLALTLGASFVARSFSGDKKQLVPLIKAALKHRGFALIDVLSPCVTFNDHEASTKSYAYAFSHYHPAVHADFVPPQEEIHVDYDKGELRPVRMHDGSTVLLKKVDSDYDASDRGRVLDYLIAHEAKGEIVTGLLFVDEGKPDLHAMNKTVKAPLNTLAFDALCPGSDKLKALLDEFR
jgi:2-oxoglutarate ferredoxin oxidoreductase subunit beta